MSQGQQISTVRSHIANEELVERVSRAVPVDGRFEVMHGIFLRRSSVPLDLGHNLSYPSLCLAVQGSKETHLGNRRYPYDASHYLISTTELPIVSRITEASVEHPYLGIIIELDPALVSSVMIEAGHAVARDKAGVSSFDVSPLDVGLLDAVTRLIRLLDSPKEINFLVPHIKREIVFRLLMGDQASRLLQLVTLGGSRHRIIEALDRIRRDFDKPLRIEDIAREFGMSVSSFHSHFKAVTAMTPLEFQKQLRLQEARKLLLGEDFDVAGAGAQVGYRDPSQFTREYRRFFGAPPLRDIERLRASGIVSSNF